MKRALNAILNMNERTAAALIVLIWVVWALATLNLEGKFG